MSELVKAAREADRELRQLGIKEGDELVSRLADRIEALEKCLQEFVTAYDANAVAVDSLEIRVGDEAPYAWHQEWLHHARALLGERR